MVGLFFGDEILPSYIGIIIIHEIRIPINHLFQGRISPSFLLGVFRGISMPWLFYCCGPIKAWKAPRTGAAWQVGKPLRTGWEDAMRVWIPTQVVISSKAAGVSKFLFFFTESVFFY